jgi:hypothetical protein
MTADVYADDWSLRGSARRTDPPGMATFTILADADADLIARVGAILNLLNVAPRELHMTPSAEGTAAIRASVACAEFQAELVARKLLRLTSVRDVKLEYDPDSVRAR